MPKQQFHRFVIFGLLLLFFNSIRSQHSPCPKIFQYVTFGHYTFGLLRLNDLPQKAIEVDVDFVQYGYITTNSSGKLSLNQDQQTTQENLESGKPISYRIDFPDPTVFPKLTSVKVNDETVCNGSGLNPPNTMFKLQHTFNTVVLTTTTDRPHYSDTDLLKYFDSLPPKKVPSVEEFREGLKAIAQNSNARPVSPIQHGVVECGIEGLVPLIFSGYPRGKFPWLVAIYVREAADLKFKCDGSLISARTVITTTHCFKSPDLDKYRISIYLGLHSLFMFERSAVYRDISKTSVHFNSNFEADIVLLHMSLPVRFNQYIRPVCLWTQSADLELIENSTGVTEGWGFDDEGDSISPEPKTYDAKIVNASECQVSSEQYRILTSHHALCARLEDKSERCFQAGSSLLFKIYGQWTLRGIRFVKRSCELGNYDVYYDIAWYTSWIRENMLE